MGDYDSAVDCAACPFPAARRELDRLRERIKELENQMAADLAQISKASLAWETRVDTLERELDFAQAAIRGGENLYMKLTAAQDELKCGNQMYAELTDKYTASEAAQEAAIRVAEQYTSKYLAERAARERVEHALLLASAEQDKLLDREARP